MDAAAAKGAVGRAGLDKVRHIGVNVLWLQEQEVSGRVPFSECGGTRNAADLRTNHVESAHTAVDLNTMSMASKWGRAEAAAQLYTTKATDEGETLSQRKIATSPC